MYVCICNAVTEKQIRQAADAGIDDLWGLQSELGVAVTCGSCKQTACDILAEGRARKAACEPRVYIPGAAWAPAAQQY